jgi:hypothetical protein
MKSFNLSMRIRIPNSEKGGFVRAFAEACRSEISRGEASKWLLEDETKLGSPVHLVYFRLEGILYYWAAGYACRMHRVATSHNIDKY